VIPKVWLLLQVLQQRSLVWWNLIWFPFFRHHASASSPTFCYVLQIELLHFRQQSEILVCANDQRHSLLIKIYRYRELGLLIHLVNSWHLLAFLASEHLRRTRCKISTTDNSSVLLSRGISFEGRAIAQAVSRGLPTAAARVHARVCSSGICGGQGGDGAGFLRDLRFPLAIIIPPNSPSSQSPRVGTIGQKLPMWRVDPVWIPPPTMRN
jgi:hypothetical protein